MTLQRAIGPTTTTPENPNADDKEVKVLKITL